MTDRYYAVTHLGRVRSSNQDRVLTRPDAGLWVVADGMGGHAGGAEASRIAAEAVEQAVTHGMELADAFEVAHSQVRMAQADDPELSEMGTTLVAVRENGDGFELAWVGDSRIYRYSPATDRFQCLTRDHNVASRLLDSGRITAEQARSHPQRHMLTDCIGQREGLPTIETARYAWQAGDRLLLCTDGLTGEVEDADILDALKTSDDLEAIGVSLADQALEAGGRDNITLIVLDAPE
ncbi:serine/threonine-protein phosphatase [Wenzhouxiangella sp. XN79A]|uniref:PP2C family protein-serine/threonine phosphatase n=1 Tax=Wenzhouxiangella sp. XN79A TaxID=2724193 RepID=UPI00144AE2F7|nr:protein phosphatase 2C domain-containing protein [Wenzhouxiangella sp. XN79A]NKI34592.1 serine/threonine-protein phosphatase [Wenzhouxiangella sp. XN79A]